MHHMKDFFLHLLIHTVTVFLQTLFGHTSVLLFTVYDLNIVLRGKQQNSEKPVDEQ